MKYVFFFCLLLILYPVQQFAQKTNKNEKQTVYFDKDYNIVAKEKAIYYIKINWLNGKIINPSTEYYMSGTLHWTGDVISCDPNTGNYITDGLCTWYDENGKKQSQVTMSSNNFNGKFTAWYPNGNLKEEANYVDGVIDGCDKSYDESGNCISATIVVMGKTDYSTIPDNPKYKVECNCPVNIQSQSNTDVPNNNNSNENSNTQISEGNIYGTGLVRDHINDKLSSEESVLFKLLSDSKYTMPLVFLNFNLHEADGNSQQVANGVYNGLMNTKDFERIPAADYKMYLDKTIYYSMGYSDVSVNFTEVPHSNATQGNFTMYMAKISCTLWINDINGKVILNKKFDGKTNIEFGGEPLGINYKTPELAFEHSVKNLQKKISKYFTKEFKFN